MKSNSFVKIILTIAVSILIIFVVKNLITDHGQKYPPENAKKDFDPNSMVKDIEGNVYKKVTIGTQVWMAENLRTITYNDGDPLVRIKYTYWSSTNKGAYCWIDNDIMYKPIFGGLYNWYAVETKKLCPIGWHVPSDSEFATLVNFLGGKNVAGSKMKDTGIVYWRKPNNDATNSSGFSALPSYYSSSNAPFGGWGGGGAKFWTSTESSTDNAWDIELKYFDGVVERYNYSKQWGYSIRCLKD